MISSHLEQYLHVLAWVSGPHTSTWMNSGNFRGYVSLRHSWQLLNRASGKGFSMNVYRRGSLPTVGPLDRELCFRFGLAIGSPFAASRARGVRLALEGVL